MFYFLTKPIFLALTYFHALVGNFGLAIMLLTVIVKAMHVSRLPINRSNP